MMIEVFNPADGSVAGTAPFMSVAEVKAAIDRTCNAFPVWSRRLAKQRAELLRRWFELVRADRRQFAEIMVRENGKCFTEAMGEIEYGLGFIEWYAEEARRVYGDILPTHADGAAVLATKEPVGPTAAITPSRDWERLAVVRRSTLLLFRGDVAMLAFRESPTIKENVLYVLQHMKDHGRLRQGYWWRSDDNGGKRMRGRRDDWQRRR